MVTTQWTDISLLGMMISFVGAAVSATASMKMREDPAKIEGTYWESNARMFKIIRREGWRTSFGFGMIAMGTIAQLIATGVPLLK